MTIIKYYMHKKVDTGKKFGFIENVFVQSLTYGLKADYQNIVIVNSLNTVTDMYRMVSKLVASSIIIHQFTSKLYLKKHFPYYNKQNYKKKKNSFLY